MKNKIQSICGITGMVLLLSLTHIASAQIKLKNFQGSWALDESKSDFGRLTAASASKVHDLKISQTEESLTVTSGDSTSKTSVTISLTGKTSEQTGSTIIYGIPNTVKTDVVVHLVNNRSFNTTVSNDPLGMAKISEKTYALSDDGNILTIEYKNDYGGQLLAGKLIYNKQR